MLIHPFANFLPSASNEEYRNIRGDIREHGLKVPLLIFNGQVLDGRTRLKACEELGIRPSFEHFHGTELDALSHIQSLNIFRRHLSQGQKAIASARIAKEFQKLEGLTVKESYQLAAKSTGASVSSTREAATIERFDQELSDQVLNGETSLEQAKQIMRPTIAPVKSARHLSAAIAEIRNSLKEMKRRRCPEQRRLEYILRDLEQIQFRVREWADNKAMNE